MKAWGKHDSNFDVFSDDGLYELRRWVIKRI